MRYFSNKGLAVEEVFRCPLCHEVYEFSTDAEDCLLQCGYKEEFNPGSLESKACPSCRLHDPVINYTSVDCPHKGKGKGVSPPFIADCENHVPVNQYDMPEGC